MFVINQLTVNNIYHNRFQNIEKQKMFNTYYNHYQDIRKESVDGWKGYDTFFSLSNKTKQDDSLDMHFEPNRLLSFSRVNLPANISNNALLLSRAGYYYDHVNMVIVCFICNMERGDHEPNENPWTIHKRDNPDCLFVQKEITSFNLEVYNQFEYDKYKNETTKFKVLANKIRQNTRKIRNSQSKPISSSLNVKVEENRIDTFGKDFKNIPWFINLAKNGHFWNRLIGKSTCPWCFINIKIDRPLIWRHLHFPDCLFYGQAFRAENDTPYTKLNLLSKLDLMTTNYKKPECRHLSFFPDDPGRGVFNAKMDNQILDFVNAGFYYKGYKTNVGCDYCDLELCDWDVSSPEDFNPKNEHIYYSPLCPFVRDLTSKKKIRKIKQNYKPKSRKLVEDTIIILPKKSETKINFPLTMSTNLSKNKKKRIEKICNTNIVKSAVEMGIPIKSIIEVVTDRINNSDRYQTLDQLLSDVSCMNKKKEIVPNFECPICMNEIGTVVLIPCGHIMCKTCYTHYKLAGTSRCHMCRKKFHSDVTIFY